MKSELIALLFLGGMVSGCGAQDVAKPIKGRFEGFIQKCMNEKVDCIDVDFTAITKSEYRVRHTYYAGRTSSVSKMLGAKDGSFTGKYLCKSKGDRNIKYSDNLFEWKNVPTSVQQSRDGIICLERYDLNDEADGGVVISEYSSLEVQKNGYVYSFYPPADARINVHISGDFSNKVYAQSALLSSGFISGETASSDFEYRSGSYPADSFFVLTTYDGVGEFAHEYDARSLELMTGSNGLGNDAEFSGAIGIESLLTKYNAFAFKFGADVSNAGILPKRSVGQIIASRFVHCMDAVQVGRYLAARNGMHAIPILTGTRKPMPDFTVAPDTQWMNHVILYFDKIGLFVDLTAEPGHQIVDGTSYIYGHMGVRVDTGGFILIK